MSERLYLVTYDITSPKRGKAVFKTMKGYGEWLQYSVFQCRLSARRYAEMVAELNDIVHKLDDHIIVVDLGKADTVKPKVTSLGKTWTPVKRQVVIV